MLTLFLICLCYGAAAGLVIPDDVGTPLPHEKVCSGTNMGFSYSGSLRRHFRLMQRRYAGCTYVHGNLEITHLRQRNINYDLSFLNNIRYVTGYVLVAMITQVKAIPLTSLEIIRGNRTLELFRREFALTVTLTANSYKSRRGLQELQLPKLREISNGNVFFSDNPVLCYVQTIMWEAIISGGKPAMLKGNQPLARQCLPCSRSCEEDGVKRCWGRGKKLCQRVEPLKCDQSCPHRCFGPGKGGCCHSQCAAGCWDETEADCEMCKNYSYEGRCVGWCPYEPNTFPYGQTCAKMDK